MDVLDEYDNTTSAEKAVVIRDTDGAFRIPWYVKLPHHGTVFSTSDGNEVEPRRVLLARAELTGRWVLHTTGRKLILIGCYSLTSAPSLYELRITNQTLSRVAVLLNAILDEPEVGLLTSLLNK